MWQQLYGVMCGGACGIMVNIVGSAHSYTSSNPEQGCSPNTTE